MEYPENLKQRIYETFRNVYKIACKNLSERSKDACTNEALESLNYLKDVSENVDKYFAYEYVFANWEKRVQDFLGGVPGGEDTVRNLFNVKRMNSEDFHEWCRRNRVDTPAKIVADNVRLVLPNETFYNEFYKFCSCVENYLCYGDTRHPKHIVFYIGQPRIWGHTKSFVSMAKSMAAQNPINRFIGNMKLKHMENYCY